MKPQIKPQIKPQMKPASAHILVVDPDHTLCALLAHFLGEAGFDVSLLHTPAQLPHDIRAASPDLVLMERSFPNGDGFASLKDLRGHGDATPVIVLSSLADAIDRVIGLELGADDYLAKPFVPSELLARIRAVLRRAPAGALSAPGASAAAIGNEARGLRDLRFGPFRIVFSSRTLLRDGEPQAMTDSQFALLTVFAQRPMETLSRSRLVTLMRGCVRDDSITVAVARLRALLEDVPTRPRWIRTVRGEGYCFVPDPEGQG
ncbi:putative DNA-binding dual transcriptional regulator OmpR [Paraburkholderia tropica]|uniref:response regulator n=1 Tax=Paraburkholderia TaxID=1822464 RepID=UPI001CB4F3FA|nr:MULTISPECIES: response regulator [Paraburkholderia]CAG9200926.1 putative DNA-binding dual transcriptional regulator OmpR [Paraburkholderia tropica]